MQIGIRKIDPSRRHLVALALLTASVLTACSGSGDGPAAIEDLGSGDLVAQTTPGGREQPAGEAPAGSEQPAAEQPAAEQPAAEQPAAEQPAAEQAPAGDGTADEGLTSQEWTVVILLGLVVLAIVIGATALATRRSGNRSQGRATDQRRLDDITRASRSIHDSAVLAVLQTNDPVRLQSMWGAGRGQLVDLESRIASLTPALPEESQRRTLHELGQAVAGVRGALESNVGLRLDPEGAGQAQLVEASNRTVLYRSEQLETALQQALYLTV